MRAPDTYSALTRPEKNSVVMQRILSRTAVAYKGGSTRESHMTTATSGRSGGKQSSARTHDEGMSSMTSARTATLPRATPPSSPYADRSTPENGSDAKPCQEVANVVTRQGERGRELGDRAATVVADTTRHTATWDDTCTGYLSTMQATMVQLLTSTEAPAADLHGVLQMCIARQNEVCAERARAVCALRQQEERDYAHHLASLTEARDRLENSCATSVFAALCAEPRRRWLRALRGRTQRVKGQKVGNAGAAEPRREGKDSMDRPARTASSRAVESVEEMDDDAGLPRPETLYRCLVDGLNDEVTRGTVKEELLRHYGGSVHLAGHGLPIHGVLSVFQPHIALFAAFPSLLPDLAGLRRDFAELHPSHAGGGRDGKAAEDAFMPETIQDAETTLDALLRGGEAVTSLSALLLRGVHPSVRRLCYARALQLDLIVVATAADRGVGRHASGGLLACLTLRPGRVGAGRGGVAPAPTAEKMPLLPQQGHRALGAALQTAMQMDVDVAVGNSNRYFVVKDDVARLGAALVGMIMVPPDPRDEGWAGAEMQSTLTQLGRPADSLSACYQLELPQPSRLADAASNVSFSATATAMSVVPPACRLLCYPVRGSSLLLAPLCYVTGDAAEQQALAGAMAGQLWCRLLGPTPELTQCCWLFESLVSHQATLAYAHVTRDLGYPMLRLALRWMLTGFAELLEPAQVLVLYDLILAYHVREMHTRGGLSNTVGPAHSALRSGGGVAATQGTPCALWLLPMLAAAIFVFRAPLLLRCATVPQLECVLLSGHELRTRALLQNLLFLAP